MKLFVVGATGQTGREIVEQALARGHDVTAFVRSPGTITLKNERLTVLKGNATDENELFEGNAKSRRGPLDTRTAAPIQTGLASLR
jgi:putative NADH-flavin reductase